MVGPSAADFHSFSPPFCPATGTFNGLHPKGDFLAVNKAIAQGMPVQIFLV